MSTIKQHGQRFIRSLKIEGRCFSCLMHEELFPADHPKSGERIYLCEYCKLEQELNESFDQVVFSARSAILAS